MKTPKTNEQFKTEAEAKYGRKMDGFEKMLSQDEKLRQALVVLGSIHEAQGGDYAFEALLGNAKGDVRTFRVSVSVVNK